MSRTSLLIFCSPMTPFSFLRFRFRSSMQYNAVSAASFKREKDETSLLRIRANSIILDSVNLTSLVRSCSTSVAMLSCIILFCEDFHRFSPMPLFWIYYKALFLTLGLCPIIQSMHGSIIAVRYIWEHDIKLWNHPKICTCSKPRGVDIDTCS